MAEVAPGPNWRLFRWVSQAAEFLAFQTVYLITDNRNLLADAVASTPRRPLAHGCCVVERKNPIRGPLW